MVELARTLQAVLAAPVLLVSLASSVMPRRVMFDGICFHKYDFNFLYIVEASVAALGGVVGGGVTAAIFVILLVVVVIVVVAVVCVKKRNKGTVSANCKYFIVVFLTIVVL